MSGLLRLRISASSWGYSHQRFCNDHGYSSTIGWMIPRARHLIVPPKVAKTNLWLICPALRTLDSTKTHSFEIESTQLRSDIHLIVKESGWFQEDQSCLSLQSGHATSTQSSRKSFIANHIEKLIGFHGFELQFDQIKRTPYYPGEDDKLRASSIIRRRGGNCPNTLEVLQQLVAHHSTETRPSLNLISILPAKESLASQQIRSQFEPHVRLDHCIYREQFQELASCFIIKSQSTGSRTVVNYNELPEMTVEDFIPIADKLGPQASWFHFEVCEVGTAVALLPPR